MFLSLLLFDVLLLIYALFPLHTINAGLVPAALTDCSMICPGNQYEYSGAGIRMGMYMRSTTTVSSTSSSVLSSSPSPSSPLSQLIIPNVSGSVLSLSSSMSSPSSSSSALSIISSTTSSTYGRRQTWQRPRLPNLPLSQLPHQVLQLLQDIPTRSAF